MSGGDPQKWEYYEKMNIVRLLKICMFYKVKREELERQQRLNKMKNGISR